MISWIVPLGNLCSVMAMVFLSSCISSTQSLSTKSPTLLRVVNLTALKMSSSSLSTHHQFRISHRTIQTLDPCVILMKQIISQHEEKWKEQGIFSLAQGVVHWKPPKTAYEAVANAIQENLDETATAARTDGSVIHTYCPDEGYLPLIAALKIKLKQQNGLDDPHVMVTSGANQAFVNCVITLMDESSFGNYNNKKEPQQEMISKCVVFEPYYFNHVMAIQSIRGGNNCGGIAAIANKKKEVEGLLVGPTRHGIPDLGWLRSQLEHYKYSGSNGIRIVTLVNPGNPTGVSLPHSFLQDVTQLTKDYGVWLVVDNTYEHFDIHNNNRDAAQPNIPFPCLDQENVINIFSFSKGYALAGFRVGYIAFSSKNGSKGKGTLAYEQMLKVQDTIAICTSRLSQMAALGALDAGREWVCDQVKTLEVGRNAILEAIVSLEEVIGGDGAMYVMGKLPNSVDDKQFASSLVEHFGVAVIPGKLFEKRMCAAASFNFFSLTFQSLEIPGSFCGYPGWIRVCYSNLPPELCVEAASRLKRGILELTKKNIV